jgi:hypothetical protein
MILKKLLPINGISGRFIILTIRSSLFYNLYFPLNLIPMLNLDKYSYTTNRKYLAYEFESIGPKGVIKKVARFTEIDNGVYNFGFGDLNEETGEINDIVISNNGDGDKILSTLASIIYDFTLIYSHASVFIKGTNEGRTRRYQMGINKYWDQIKPVFKIWGQKNGKWEFFLQG